MKNRISVQLTAIALVGAFFVGCANLPGNKQTQGAVIGGASGAAVGAAVGGSKNRATGAILGGVLGAAGGYVIGANSDKIIGKNKGSAEDAATRAKSAPATAEQARNASTADINTDGYVTLDEVAAMRDAGLSDADMLSRLRATGQIFDLSADSQKYLRDRGISENVISQMQSLNQENRDRLLHQLDQPR